MTKLSSLRSRLADVRRRRQAVRWGTGYAALALAILWVLVAAFLVDWSLELTRAQRALSLVVCIGLVAWAARQFTLPWLGQRESDLDIALLVERQQRIDSDLVAALQFETAEAPRWGSTQLEGAVIDYVAEFGRGWNFLEGFSKEQLVRRGAMLAATVVIIFAAVVIAPRHVGAFLNRFFLGSLHYPTKTSIDELQINRKLVELTPGGSATEKTPQGQPVLFEVRGSGELPSEGTVRLQTVGSGLDTTINLTKNASDESQSAATYVGQLPKLSDSVSYQLYLGDAWTDPAILQVIERPVVETKLIATAPEYASVAAANADLGEGSRQISVLEGSSVALHLDCKNKALSSATMSIEKVQYPLRDVSDPEKPGRQWTLEAANNPFARVEKPIRYEIQVTDEDGLNLEQPIQGFIRIKADQRPRITVTAEVTKHLLPTASPEIEYWAMDDHGIGKLLLHVEIKRGKEASVPEEKTFSMRKMTGPLLRTRLPARGKYDLKLSTLKLAKGDQLKVTLEAVDYRGKNHEGQSAQSEPLVLDITDESGILAALSESDERAVRQLDAMIKRQLGIGDTK